MTARPALALGLCASLGTWLVAGLRRLSVVDESMSAALERHDSTAARSQAVMEELAGLPRGHQIDAGANSRSGGSAGGRACNATRLSSRYP